MRLEHDDESMEGPFSAAVHYGPRPVFKDTKSFEIHIIDAAPKKVAKNVTVEIVARLREVRDFESPEALARQIEKDIEETRGILQDTHALPSQVPPRQP